MKLALIILAALAVLVLVWAVVLPQLGMGAQWAAWRAYKRKHEGDERQDEKNREEI